jgi:hypothetical protein
MKSNQIIMNKITPKLKPNLTSLNPDKTVFNFLISYSKSIHFVKIGKKMCEIHLN